MSKISAEIVQVNFHGDTVDAFKNDSGEILVLPSRICDSLGIAWEPQRRKLASCFWACTTITEVQLGGQCREVTAMIPLKVVPMWLATIHLSKVAFGVRSKLEAYHSEFAEVLANWYDGPRKASEARLTEIEKTCKTTVLQLGVERACRIQLDVEVAHHGAWSPRRVVANFMDGA